MTTLGKTVGVVSEKLQPFVDQTRTRVGDDKGRLNKEATDKALPTWARGSTRR